MSRPNRAPALKCERCRKDHHACLPRDRAWLERDCDRCIHYHYRCGPSLPPPQGPTSGAVNSHEYRKKMGLVIAFSRDGPYTVYACMLSLAVIAWDYAGLFDAAVPEVSSGVGFLGVTAGVLKGKMYAPNLILFRHWERGSYIYAHDMVDELYRANLATTNASEAKRLATEEYIQDVHAGQIEKDSEISSREDIREAVCHILHRGARWRSLVEAIGSAEALLMDDRLYVGVRKAIGDIIKDGTDEEFDKLKTDLLNVEGRMRDTCLALSGVTEMLYELADSPSDSTTRQELTRAITRRFETVFGQQWPDTQRDPHKKVTISSNHLSRSSSDHLSRSIMDIFGISISFPKARGQLTDADKSSLTVDEQFEKLMGESHRDPDIHDSMEVEEPQGSSISGPTPPGIYAGLSPSNDFPYAELEWLG